jgi:MFS family permease
MPLSGLNSYSLIDISYPFGFGLEYTPWPFLKIRAEISPRKTYTDYLDDVSADYYDLNKIRIYSSDLAAKMAYRETDWNFDNIPDVDGIQRGNPNNNDWYIIHQVSFLEERLGSRSEAAFTLSVTAFGSIVARLLVGIFADGVDKRLLTVILFVVQATCTLLIVSIDNVATTWVLTLIFGFTIGNIYMMQSLLVGELFGMVSFGSLFGLISFAGQLGSALGPIGVGFLHDQSDGYGLPFAVTAAITYCAAVVILFARPQKAAQHATSAMPAPVGSPGSGGGGAA